MFDYEIFDDIYVKFKRSCKENLSDIIGLNQKYMAGRYEIKLFLDSNYEVRTDSMLDFLNRKLDESELGDCTEFELCTGIVDYDIMP